MTWSVRTTRKFCADHARLTHGYSCENSKSQGTFSCERSQMLKLWQLTISSCDVNLNTKGSFQAWVWERELPLRRTCKLCYFMFNLKFGFLFLADQFYKRLCSLDNVSRSMFFFSSCFIKCFNFFFCCFSRLQYACGLGSDANVSMWWYFDCLFFC